MFVRFFSEINCGRRCASADCRSWSGLLGPLSAHGSEYLHIPDRENAAGLSEVRLLLDTTDALLENGRDLGGRGLGVGVGTGLDGGDSRCGISGLVEKIRLAEVRAEQFRSSSKSSKAAPKRSSVAKGDNLTTQLDSQNIFLMDACRFASRFDGWLGTVGG